jgi:flagellar assembly protein FliH
MSTSPDLRGVLPADEADEIAAARFDLNFGGAVLPEKVLAEARSVAHAQGYAAGWAQGRQAAASAAQAAATATAAGAQAAAADYAGRVESALAAVVASARQLERRAEPTAAEVGDAVLAAAMLLTETLVWHELAVTESPGLDALRRAVDLAPVGRPVQVRLNPAEYAALTSTGPAQRDVDGRTVTMVPDPALSPGDALADCDATRIDARMEQALVRVRSVLSGQSVAGAGT